MMAKSVKNWQSEWLFTLAKLSKDGRLRRGREQTGQRAKPKTTGPDNSAILCQHSKRIRDCFMHVRLACELNMPQARLRD